MKKEIVIVFVSIMLILQIATGCSGSSKSSKEMEGNYKLTTVVVRDYRMEPSDYNAEQSYITVTGTDDNTFSFLNLRLLDDSAIIRGYIVTDRKSDNSIRYKFHITENVGTLIPSSVEWFYLYYDPDTNSVEIDVADEIQLSFAK